MARTEVNGRQIKDQSVDLSVDVTGVLPVANGGSGSTTLALNNVLLGNGVGALQAVAPGASGNVLTSDGSTWVSSSLSSVAGASGASGAPGASGVPGMDGATGPVGATGASGSVLNSYQGLWDNYASYGPGDIVTHDGSTYILENYAGWTVGGAPPAYGWSLLASVGASGASGASGVPGQDGATGPAGASGAPGADGASGSPGASGATGPAGPSTVADNVFTLQDNLDSTKQAQFQVSAVSTATTRTYSLPDADTTLVGTDTTQALTSKTISGTSNTLSDIAQSSVTNLTTDLAAKESAANKGVANGYASLDTNGKVPGSQLPNSIMTYEGLHDASANSPSLSDATGEAGQVYRVSTGGSRDYGSGTLSLVAGDYLIHNGTVWEKADTTDAISSINGYTGAVTLTKSDVGLGNVDNTSDADKNSATATLSNKTLASPAITGTASVAQSGAISIFNTADQTTSYERGRLYWSGNLFTIASESTTGTVRNFRLVCSNNTFTMTPSGTAFNFNRDTTNLTTLISYTGTLSNTSVVSNIFSILPTINQSGTGGYVGLLINPTETATGSGTKRLISAQVGGSDRFVVDNAGNVTASGSYSEPRINGSIRDTSGNIFLTFGQNGSGTPVNYVRFSNSIAGYAPGMVVDGSDTNLDFSISPKGTGRLTLWANSQSSMAIQANGSGTDVSLNLITKGAGTVQSNGTAVLLSGGALGTPSSGALTNCTGLPVAGISATGTRDSTTYLRGDGTWATSGGVTSVNGATGAITNVLTTTNAVNVQYKSLDSTNTFPSSLATTGKAIAMAMIFG